jgi:hypothetical protein
LVPGPRRPCAGDCCAHQVSANVSRDDDLMQALVWMFDVLGA